MAYPTSADNLATNKADSTQMGGDHPGHHNALAAAVNAIETELGLTPSDSYDTVKARLDAIATALAAKQDSSTAATDAELSTHAADTTSVHGIADTSVLATDAELSTHASDTTSVHGIADTANVELTTNKSDDEDLGTSTSVYVTQRAIKAYVDANAGGGTSHGIHVKDYATGDGTTNDTAAFQAAVDDAIEQGKPLVVDPGYSYLINGQVNVDTSGGVDANYFQWIMPFAGFQTGNPFAGFASKIICGNTSGPCIRFGSATEFRQGIYVDGLKVVANANRYRQPMVSFGISQGTTDFGGFGHFMLRNLFADGGPVAVGGPFDTDGFLFHTALNGAVRGAFAQNMAGGVPYVLKAGRTNVGNITFEDCWAQQAPIGWLLSEYNPDGAVLMNSYRFTNCKMLGTSDGYMTSIGRPASGPSEPNSRFISITVAAAGAASGQKVVPLDSSSGIAAGMWVTICKANGQLWVDRVTSVSSPNVTLTTNLPFALVQNDRVVAGNWHTVCGSGVETVRSVTQEIPHWENCNGFLAQSVRGVEINRPFLGNGVGRGVYCAFSAQQVKVDGIQATSGIEVPDNAVILHQANHSGNSRNQVRNSCLSDWRTGVASNAPVISPNIIQVDGGSNVAYNERFGGIPAMLGVWRRDTAVAASLTASQLIGPQGSATRSIRVPHYGAAVGVQASVTTARTGGTLTAELYKNGSATGLTAVIDGTDTLTNISESTDVENTGIQLAPGDRVDVRITTTGAWAPTANDVDVTVWVEQ